MRISLCVSFYLDGGLGDEEDQPHIYVVLNILLVLQNPFHYVCFGR